MLRPDLLAVVAPAVVRSLPMTTPGDTTARLLRTKQRLYVLCQTVGWGLFLVSQLAFSYVLSEGEERRRLTAFSGISSLSVAVVLGFLLSHYSRSTMAGAVSFPGCCSWAAASPSSGWRATSAIPT